MSTIPGRTKKIFLSLGILALFSSALVGLFWWSIHAPWFAALVRDRIVSALHTATAGRVELRSFTLDPDTLHARINGLAVHGTEPSGSLPLLSIDSVDVGLKILSVLRRDVDIQSMVVNHPEIHLLINPDGTTNVPIPKRRQSKTSVEQLLDLKIKRLSINRGLLQVNNRKVPFQFVSQGMGLLLDYNFSGPSYGVSLQTEAVNFTFPGLTLRPMRISAQGRLFKDRADIDSLSLVTGHGSSTFQLIGRIEHLAQPFAEAKLDASLSIDELAQMGGINAMLRNGRGTLNGVIRFNAASGKFNFAGKAQAQGVAFESPEFTLRNIAADADMIADNDGISLHHGHGTARGARFTGEGTIKDYSFLQVTGHVSEVALREVGTYLTNSPFPWSGTAQGAAYASAHLMDKEPDFIIGAKVTVQPGKTGIPTSGNVDVDFHARGTKVNFGPSTLHLPHSTVNFNGTLDTDLSVRADTADLADIRPILPIIGAKLGPGVLPKLSPEGTGKFDGTLHDLLHQPSIQGSLNLSKFALQGYDWDSFNGQFAYSPAALSVPQFQLDRAAARLTGEASALLSKWFVTSDSPLTLQAHFNNLDMVKTAALFSDVRLPVTQGVASGDVNFKGTLNHPRGAGVFHIANLYASGEKLNQVQFDAALDDDRLQIGKGKVQSGPALLTFSGAYRHGPALWSSGNLDFEADTNGFPLSGLSTVRKYFPALDGRAEIHLQGSAKVLSSGLEPLNMNGAASLSKVSLNGRDLGAASLKAVTEGNWIRFNYSGDLRDTKFHGHADAQLTAGTPTRGDLQVERINFATVRSLLAGTGLLLPVDGYLDGNLTFDGLLEQPSQMHARATIEHLQMNSTPGLSSIARASLPDIILHNNSPVLLDIADGELNFTSFEIAGHDTSVRIGGSVPLFGDKPINVKAVGKANLALFTLFDGNVRSSGSSELEANVTGTLAAPNVTGQLAISNGSFFPADLPNGLSDVNGTVLFSRNRATIQKMSAHSGGGDIALGGSLSFGSGSPLVYHLEAAARNVRVRYGNSISITANSDLRLSGTSDSSVLSGTLTVTRVVFTPNADAGNLLTAASSFTSSTNEQNNFISGLHLDISVESAPNLQVSTNLSRDVEAEIQLHLRGTPDHPIVLGNVTANQGDLKIFGTRFSLNRGEVDFVNTVRVEPVLDLDLETRARGVTVDITVSGTPSKLNFNYRSDPPLQPRDIIALLTVGRTPGVGTTSTAPNSSDVGALTSGVNSVLGQAVSPVSNRLSKLFGITNIKIDPFVQGITNTPQARLSIEQQISPDVTITYVTNLSQTSEQIFRFEWALSRQYSIVALRDDNGEFGIDFQYKKLFK